MKRDNPWDPCNGCHPVEELPALREYYKAYITGQIDSVLTSLDETVNASRSNFNQVLQKNDTITENNGVVLDAVLQIYRYNDSIEEINRSIECNKATEKNLIHPRLNKKRNIENTTVKQCITVLNDSRDSSMLLIEEAQILCGKNNVLPEEYISIVYKRFYDTLSLWDSLAGSIDLYFNDVVAYNALIDSLNDTYRVTDSLTVRYNDSLFDCRVPWITDPAELKARIDTLRPGDTIPIGLTSIEIDNLTLQNKGDSTGKWIVITGSPVTGLTLKTIGGAEITGSKKIRFENILFSGMGNGVGMRVLNGSDSIAFVNCSFSDNTGHGFEANSSVCVYFEHCVFMRNGTAAGQDNEPGSSSGLRISECEFVTGKNILVAQNKGFGIDINKSNVIFHQSTVSDNLLSGISYTGKASEGGYLSYSSVYCFNGAYGIYRNNEQTSVDVHVTSDRNNRFHENNLGPLGGDPATIAANSPFSEADPLFVNRENGDYTIGAASPLFIQNIGYKP